ncbi:MAG: hypothetical protein KAV87_39870, partial [Desulfobacteraceae bacterium]|nr:hypothetical protein [Desulfobacteraceae bacterium]
LFGVMKVLQKAARKTKMPIEEIQRSFWVEEVNEIWSDDMEIFKLLERKKLHNYLTNGQEVSKLKAKILHLNRIINECRPRL